MRGVRAAAVSLAGGAARVKACTELTSPRQLADAVYDLGFDVAILTVDGQPYSGATLIVHTYTHAHVLTCLHVYLSKHAHATMHNLCKRMFDSILFSTLIMCFKRT